jgi:hypothetical protein
VRRSSRSAWLLTSPLYTENGMVSECLLVHLPRTHQQVNEVTEAFLSHDNDERPNQARSCGNRPPHVACPDFPFLPAVPEMVDPDHWLEQVKKQAFARSEQGDGSVTINHEKYSLGRELAAQHVTCLVNAREQQFDVWRVKQLPIKGLSGKPLPFEEDVSGISQEARSDF